MAAPQLLQLLLRLERRPSGFQLDRIERLRAGGRRRRFRCSRRSLAALARSGRARPAFARGRLRSRLLHLPLQGRQVGFQAAELIAEAAEGLPAVAAQAHQLPQPGFGLVGQCAGAGGPGPLHPPLPLCDLAGQLQQGATQPFRLRLHLQLPLLQSPLPFLLLLLVQQLALLGVAAEERLQLLLQLRLQLLEPVAAHGRCLRQTPALIPVPA